MPSEALSTVQPDEAVALLKANASFSALGEKALRETVAHSVVERVRAGTLLFSQGEVGTYCYLVLDGSVSVDVTTSAGTATVAVLSKGSLVGEIGAFASTERTASVRVVTDAVLLRIDQTTIRQLVSSNNESLLEVIGQMGRRLQQQNVTLATLTQACRALATDSFEPDMLDVLRDEAERLHHFADVFAEMAGEISKKRSRRQEMATAAEIQQALLPGWIDGGVHAERFEVGAAMWPAKRVGGDFYDFFMIDDDTLAVAVGDVSGKGVPAAIFMSVSRTVLRAVARRNLSAAQTLTDANAQLSEGNSEAMFVTIAYGKLNLRTGRFEHASGGHEEVLIARPGEEVWMPAPTGPALGIFPDARFDNIETDLPPGTVITFATDGITEAFNHDGDMFGRDRLIAALRDSEGLEAEATVSRIADTVSDFVGDLPQADDLTGLVLRYTGMSKDT
ncbi:MAG: SpoIIE family protein phosphatase [Pseudomonadota bacterium]